MKIIKVNEGNEKVKYEIYNMYLNQERARRYREEQAKKLEFYRLEFKVSYDLSCLGLINYIECIGKNGEKYIYEFTIVEKGKKGKYTAYYGEYNSLIISKYFFKPYGSLARYSNYCKEKEKEGLNQKEEFIDYFIKEGLSDYQFKHLSRSGCAMQTYIFLNSIVSDNRDCHIDNVVCLPNEITTMYLLDKGYIEEMYYYINKINWKEEKKIFASFDFEKSSTFTVHQMKDLLNSGLIEEEALTRKIALDKYITNYIK